MTILLHRAIALGDNVVAIKAIYALKCLYPSAKIIVATNNIGAQIYSKLPFIDALLNIDANPRAIYELESIDYFIATHRTSALITLAKSTNARKIVLCAHLHSLHSPRFINDFNFYGKGRAESGNLLRLVRVINRRVFDRGIKSIDFSGAKLRWGCENSVFVKAFFANIMMGGGL